MTASTHMAAPASAIATYITTATNRHRAPDWERGRGKLRARRQPLGQTASRAVILHWLTDPNAETGVGHL